MTFTLSEVSADGMVRVQIATIDARDEAELLSALEDARGLMTERRVLAPADAAALQLVLRMSARRSCR